MNNSLIHRIARGCLVVTTFLLCAPARGAEPSSPPKRIVGYMSEWGDFRAAEFPADLLTHINYAFGRITNGECTLGRSPATDPVEAVPARLVELQQLKQKHPHLKTLVSLGGWGGSG